MIPEVPFYMYLPPHYHQQELPMDATYVNPLYSNKDPIQVYHFNQPSPSSGTVHPHQSHNEPAESSKEVENFQSHLFFLY